jgi:trehalose 6-phosphate synthase
MMRKLRAGTIQQWFTDFSDALQDAHASNKNSATDLPAVESPKSWPLHVVGSPSGARVH